jgi:hypothetical protein
VLAVALPSVLSHRDADSYTVGRAQCCAHPFADCSTDEGSDCYSNNCSTNSCTNQKPHLRANAVSVTPAHCLSYYGTDSSTHVRADTSSPTSLV